MTLALQIGGGLIVLYIATRLVCHAYFRSKLEYENKFKFNKENGYAKG